MPYSKEIGNLLLPPRIVEALKKAKLNTCKSVLTLSDLELSKQTKLSQRDVYAVKQAVSQEVLPRSFITAYKLQLPECPPDLVIRKLSSGCPMLDQFLRGGLLMRGVTEIAGESASGKTQFCLQLSLQAQLPEYIGGLNAAVAYICTEDSFPSKRLQQLIQGIKKNKPHEASKINFSDQIYISQIGDVESMWKCVKVTLPNLLRLKKVKLIIIDSVAALFRCEYDLNQIAQRAHDLQTLGHLLHKIALDFGAVVICINQVSAVVDQGGRSNVQEKIVPSLGLAWSNLVTTRVMLSRTSYVYKETTTQLKVYLPVRKLQVLYAPNLPPNHTYFVVTPDCVRGISLDENCS
ncbi:DNA repair protein XRCC3-like isoform X1 [Limulus polyphemus]|uniref:DNA repair protein XRCC3-like isoform X1 n=1 Tax=Limulus polyphemus TaxID=6850 RepID=A0ABM1TJM0_LIMPO|nr:DNA repair protein XRCC3-like isoform X1 [Limulus polyphemus]XP_022256074.1 DNA repair protein XRCC3-like isoform X1 [Limulus polyphemus]XP_022256076.1 DNA repair protein XRCC3-like isoform X1 [Limulus polyphemus]